jgi:hypothetical protein
MSRCEHRQKRIEFQIREWSKKRYRVEKRSFSGAFGFQHFDIALLSASPEMQNRMDSLGWPEASDLSYGEATLFMFLEMEGGKMQKQHRVLLQYRIPILCTTTGT